MLRVWMAMVAAVTLCSGCANSETQRRIGALETSLAKLQTDSSSADAQSALKVGALEVAVANLELSAKKVDAQVDQMGRLSADLDSVRSYFRDVKVNVREMRDAVITLIDEQRMMVEQGRSEYLRILQRQKEMLDAMGTEVDSAISALETRQPEAATTVPQPPADPELRAAPAQQQQPEGEPAPVVPSSVPPTVPESTVTPAAR